MRRTFIALFAFTASSAAAVLACGSLVDPATSSTPTPTTTPAATTTGDASAGATTTLSGALTVGTTAPAGARVALVWRGPNTTVVSNNDVALGSDGSLSMDLPAPPDGYLVPASVTGPGFYYDAPPEQPTNSALRGAQAGFVVYEDTNGNGRFDIINASTGETSDRVLGLSEDYYVFYYKGGSALDYEKLRDSSGVAPHDGFNLFWDTRSRFMPLDIVEIELGPDLGFPSTFCDGVGIPAIPLGGNVVTELTGFPPPGDPHLKCAPGGRSWSLDSELGSPADVLDPSVNCTAWPGIDRPSLCMGSATCASGEQWFPDAGPLPANWPCTLSDAGP